MRKAEGPDALGKAFWSQGYKARASIQRELNKSADTQALPDLSETDATIAMLQLQAKQKGTQTEQATAQKTVAAQRKMNKSAVAHALESLLETEKNRIEVAQNCCNADPAIWTYLSSSTGPKVCSLASTVPNACAISATDDAVYTHQKKLWGNMTPNVLSWMSLANTPTTGCLQLIR